MKLRLCVTALAIILALGACTKSKKLYSLTGLEESAPTVAPVDLAAYEARYGEYDGVFLSYDQIVEHAGGKEQSAASLFFPVPSTWLYQEITRTRYIVFNPRVDWLTTFSLWAQPKDLFLRITNPDGSRREYGLADLRPEDDEFGRKSHRFIFPDVQRGSIIETGYAIEFDVGLVPPPLRHDVLLQLGVPAEQVSFTYACPEWWTYQVKKNGDNRVPELDITFDPQTKKALLKAVRRNVPAVKSERYAPYFRDVADYLEFQVTKLEMAGAKYEAAGNWTELGDRIYDGAMKDMDEVTMDIRQQIQLAVGPVELPLDKVNRVLAFVRDSVDIDGKNRRGNPGKILKDRKGDVFDVNALTCVMLSELGIPSDFLLAHSALSGYCDPEYVSIEQFYYPATGCRIDGDYYVLFPYIEGLPPGLVPPWFLDQKALAIKKGGVTMIDLPDSSLVPGGVTEQYDLTIDETGLITVDEERVLTGADAFLMRDSLSTLTPPEMQEAASRMLTYSDGSVRLESFDVDGLHEPTEPLRLTFRYTIDNLVTVTPDEVVFQTAGLFAPISGARLVDDPAQRVNDVAVLFAADHRKLIRIHHPSSWSLSTVPADIQKSNEFGSVSGQFARESGFLSVDQHVHLNRIRRPKEAYAEFLDIAGQHSDLHIPTLVFALNEGIAPAPAPDSDDAGQ
ncbi:MAG: hypothetical protein RBT76_11535 [candidate division Zixibacteria bacterium]|jgi:hypothetical protein|nr:hypothetical protein [candidate division Zixibacteria bacterium]